MQVHSVVRRAVAATAALALTTVGFVALPGAANATPACTPVVVDQDGADIGAWTPGDLLCLDFSGPLGHYNAVAATDTGRPEGAQDVFEGWNAESAVLTWSVPQEGVTASPEILLDTDDDWVLNATYSWVQTPPPGEDPPPEEPPAPALATAPTTLSVESTTDTSIAVSWSGASGGDSGIDHYRIAWYLDGEEIDTDNVYDATEFTVSPLLADTSYEIRVWTVAVDESVSADYASITQGTDSASAPVGDEVTAYTQGTWFFDVLANDAGSPETATLVSEPEHGYAAWDGTKFQYYVLDNEATSDSFTYRNDVSGETATVSITIEPVVMPTAPVVTEETANGRYSITVSWTASEARTFAFWRYIVTWYKPGVGWQELVTTETSVTIEDLTPGTEYVVDVMGEDVMANFSDSDRANVTTDAEPAPDRPMGLEAQSAGRYAVDLAWDPTEQAVSSYRIYYQIMGDEGWSRAADEDGSATGAHLTGLEADATYLFRVLACDASDRCSDPASTDASTEVVRPGAPEVTAEAAGTDSIALSWTESTGGNGEIDGYDVFYRVAGDGDWTYFDYFDAEDREYTIDGLDPATEYEFKVIAWDVDEFSSDDGLATATTDSDLPPAPVMPQISTSDAIVSGGTASFTISEVGESATVEAGVLVDGVSAVHVDGLEVELVTVAGFSGTISQPLLVSDGGDPVELTADVVVNPAAASRATYRIASATSSRITWASGIGAHGYVVKVGGTTVCTTATASCLVARLLGPASIVTVTATGHDGTVALAARATWVSAPVNFGHVHFVGDSPTLVPSSATYLRTLTAKLMAAGVTRVTVHGYTATQGTATRTAVQLRLSAMRANAVAAYMTAYYAAHGKTLRVLRVADGATHPIASNATAAGRAENRRAEVVLG